MSYLQFATVVCAVTASESGRHTAIIAQKIAGIPYAIAQSFEYQVKTHSHVASS